MTQREETRQEEVDMGNMQERESADFENLMIKRKAKEKIQESEWSEVKVDDVQVYSGIEYTKAEMARKRGTDTTVKGTIAGDRSINQIISEVDRGDTSSYKTNVPKFTHPDGAVMHNGRKYLYRSREWIIVTVSSRDGTYSNEFVITRTPKFEDSGLEDVYKEIAEEIGEDGSIGSPPDSNKTYIRTDRVLNTSRSGMIAKALMRMGIMGSAIVAGFFGSMAIMVATGSLLVGTMFLATVIFTASLLQQEMYEGWFEAVSLDWMDELPEEARITDQVTKDMEANQFQTNRNTKLDFMQTDGEVTTEADGTLKINTPMSSWKFEGEEDGVPSDEAIKLYKSYGGVNFTEVDKVPVQIAEYDERVPLKDNYFLSEDEEWVLKADGI